MISFFSIDCTELKASTIEFSSINTIAISIERNNQKHTKYHVKHNRRRRWNSNELDGSLLIVFCCCSCCAFAIIIEQVNESNKWMTESNAIHTSSSATSIGLSYINSRIYKEFVSSIELFSQLYFLRSLFWQTIRDELLNGGVVNGGVIFNGHRIWTIWKIIFRTCPQQKCAYQNFRSDWILVIVTLIWWHRHRHAPIIQASFFSFPLHFYFAFTLCCMCRTVMNADQFWYTYITSILECSTRNKFSQVITFIWHFLSHNFDIFISGMHRWPADPIDNMCHSTKLMKLLFLIQMCLPISMKVNCVSQF